MREDECAYARTSVVTGGSGDGGAGGTHNTHDTHALNAAPTPTTRAHVVLGARCAQCATVASCNDDTGERQPDRIRDDEGARRDSPFSFTLIDKHVQFHWIFPNWR